MEIDIRDFFSTETLESIDGVEDFIDIQQEFNKLPEREQKILYLRLLDYTQEEIGAIVGLSQRHIGRVLANMSKSGFEMPQD